MPPDPDRKSILMVIPFFPYPPRADGGTVRYLPIIEYLSKRHDLDLVVVDSAARDRKEIDAVERLCRNLAIIPNPKKRKAGLFGKIRLFADSLMPWSPPNFFLTHGGDAFVEDISGASRGRSYDCLVWVAGYFAEYLKPVMKKIRAKKTLVDFIDSPSLWERRQQEKAGRMSLFGRYNCWRIKRWEADIIRSADASIYVSEIDAAAASPAGSASRMHVVPNGILTDNQDVPARKDVPSPNIGFLGNMSYRPNIEAVHWLHEHVFSPLREKNGDLSMIVIGRDPVDSITALGRKPGVVVTGTVEEIWPYVNAVDIFLFPLLIGAGMKNKILEAMYAGKPVLTTPIGNEGINAFHGRDLLICRSPEDFRRVTTRLLEFPEERLRLGSSAHGYIVGKFTWDGIMKDYERLLCR